VDTPCGTLSADAAAVLAEYFRYTDLAAHVRALPDAVAVLASPDCALDRASILSQLESEIRGRLEQLHALGLYPTPIIDEEVTVNGVPITLPEICRESTTNSLPQGSPTDEGSMHTSFEASDLHDHHNGLDSSMEVSSPTGVFACYVRPYLPYAVTFAAGAICGVVGTRYFAGSREVTGLDA
jgi:hypothetical protein